MSLDRSRLAKLLELVGSSFDGEAFNAARKAHAMVKASGLSWEKILEDGSDNSFFGVKPSAFKGKTWQPQPPDEWWGQPEHFNCRSGVEPEDITDALRYAYGGKKGKLTPEDTFFSLTLLLGMVVVILDSGLISKENKEKFKIIRSKLDAGIYPAPNEVEAIKQIYTIVMR